MKRGKHSTGEWYPLFIDKWLFGSTRHELILGPEWATRYPDLVPLIPVELLTGKVLDLRGVYQDLLTLSKKDSGYIRANETTPYPLSQLAGLFCVPEDYLRATIAICLSKDVNKLEEPTPGIYYISSTEIYSLSDRWKREVFSSANAEQGAGNKDDPSSKPAGLTKQNKTKQNNIKPSDIDPIDYELTDLLISLMRSNNPKSAILKRMTPETRMKWADVSRKLRDIDGHTCEEIRYLIRFSQADQFWHTNVLSMAALRKYWDRLEMQARSRNWRPTDNVGRNKGKAPDPAVEQRINELVTSFWVGCQAEEEAARNRGPAEYEKFKTAKTAELEKLIIKARYGSEN